MPDESAELAELRQKLEAQDGLVGRGTLADGMRHILDCVGDLKREQRRIESWVWTVKGSLVIVPVVLAMLAWWIVDLNNRLTAKSDVVMRDRYIEQIDRRLDGIEDHIRYNDGRIDKLRDRISHRR